MKHSEEVWYNGAYENWNEAKLHILSHGFHYGGAVFEGIRVYGGHPFKLREHLDRFFASATHLSYRIPYAIEELHEAVTYLIRISGIREGYLRPLAWRGLGDIEIHAPENPINVAIALWEWPNVFGEDVEHSGLKLKVSKWRRPDSRSSPYQAKAAGIYTLSTLAKFEAKDSGFDDALMQDYRNYIAEASAANIFFVKEGELFTPIPDCFLAGITRATVIQIANESGIKVHEERLTLDQIGTFDEIFLTGTAYEILPVTQIDNIKVRLGPVTRFVQNRYAQLCGKSSVYV